MTPKVILDSLDEISVKYINFNNEIKNGIIVCNRSISDDLKGIFNELLEIKFPIYQVLPVSEFDNDDIKSVMANNSSCFNWRLVLGSVNLSDHATGNAIDINPMQNPWVHPSAHKIEGREYNIHAKGTITPNIVEIFKRKGFTWGGIWRNPDYQHFFKPDIELKKIALQEVNTVKKFNEF